MLNRRALLALLVLATPTLIIIAFNVVSPLHSNALPPTNIVLAQSIPDPAVPPSSLVAWTTLSPTPQLSNIISAIEGLGGRIINSTDTMVEGWITYYPLRNFATCTNIGGVSVDVYIRAYSNGLVIAYTPELSTEELYKLAYIEGVQNNIPIIKPLVLKTLEDLSSRLGTNMEAVKYGSTQYPEARAVLILWSDKYTRTQRDISLGTYTINNQSAIIASSISWIVRLRSCESFCDYLYGYIDGRQYFNVYNWHLSDYYGSCRIFSFRINDANIRQGSHTVRFVSDCDSGCDYNDFMSILVFYIRS